MAKPPKLADALRDLAALIDAALNAGQRGDGSRERDWQPWSNLGFADKIIGSEAAVRTWRDTENPSRPKNIIPLLKAFYGDIRKYAEARQSMLTAWRRAGGIEDDSPPLPAPRTITAEEFSDSVHIVALEVSQPTPDNNGNLIVPYTLRIHPDNDCTIADQTVEIGVTAPYFVVESAQWQPSQDSVFRGMTHPNTRDTTGQPGATQIFKPADDQGRIDGKPFGDKPSETLEPRIEGADSPITFSVRVKPNGFTVTARGASDPTSAQKAVLDAIIASAVPRDSKHRLIVASETVHPRAGKANT